MYMYMCMCQLGTSRVREAGEGSLHLIGGGLMRVGRRPAWARRAGLLLVVIGVLGAAAGRAAAQRAPRTGWAVLDDGGAAASCRTAAADGCGGARRPNPDSLWH